MTPRKLLIFPLDMDDAEAIIRVARALGVELVGASSAMTDRGQREVDHFVQLPYVTDPDFDAALQRVVCEHAIEWVYAPHQGVWRHLDRQLQADPGRFAFRLCGPQPFVATQQRFAPHEAWAATLAAETAGVSEASAPRRPPLSPAAYAALHRQYLAVPGDSDVTKLRALADIARALPEGDLLEVGCLYGRSAFALGFLASRYRLGSLICVDPWDTARLTDQGEAAHLINAELTNSTIDSETIFRIFVSTVAMLDNVGYLRDTSESAIAAYISAAQQGRLCSPELGCVPVSGRLSLLHIDGNHRYDHVLRDVAIWSRYLVSGGWLLLDDYVWAFGDGPQRVGDALLASPLYDAAFVSSDTLFLRRTEVAAT